MGLRPRAPPKSLGLPALALKIEASNSNNNNDDDDDDNDDDDDPPAGRPANIIHEFPPAGGRPT